jgi:hypothetical protein
MLSAVEDKLVEFIWSYAIVVIILSKKATEQPKEEEP